MPEKERVVFSWSGGKDSALALHEIRRSGRYEVVALLTTVAEQYKRISHHGVREELLDMQAEAVGLPLDKLYLPANAPLPCTNAQFEELMGRRSRSITPPAYSWWPTETFFFRTCATIGNATWPRWA